MLFPTEERPTRADAVRNRRRLLDVARHMLEDGTLETSTMSDIAKAAGVGKGTLYRHFTDKAILCMELLDEAMRDFQARALEHFSAPLSPTEKLHWFLQQAILYTEGHMSLLCEAANQARPTEIRLHPAHLWWRQTIRGLLLQIPLKGDVDYLADILYLMIDVETLRFQRRSQGYTVERILRGVNTSLAQLLRVD